MNLQNLYLQQSLPENIQNEMLDVAGYEQTKIDKSKLLTKKGVFPFEQALSELNPEIIAESVETDSYTGQVIFKNEKMLDKNSLSILNKMLKLLMPWRKGPWNYFGIEIDAEWQSQLKWNRIEKHISDYPDQRICDIGCNNLYYMYRLLDFRPEFLYGIDPMVRYYYHYVLNQHLYSVSSLHFDLLGIEDMKCFGPIFDTVLFMGILYHRRDPIQSLDLVKSLLRSKGVLILESACIPGKDSVCLFPEKRYCKAPGYWFLPTQSALVNMVKRAGFRSVEVIEVIEADTGEQRRTDWAVFESLDDFLCTTDPSKTVEGYPAPIRVYIRAIK